MCFCRGSDPHPGVFPSAPPENPLLQGRAVCARLQLLIKAERNCSSQDSSSKKQEIRSASKEDDSRLESSAAHAQAAKQSRNFALCGIENEKMHSRA